MRTEFHWYLFNKESLIFQHLDEISVTVFHGFHHLFDSGIFAGIGQGLGDDGDLVVVVLFARKLLNYFFDQHSGQVDFGKIFRERLKKGQ